MFVINRRVHHTFEEAQALHDPVTKYFVMADTSQQDEWTRVVVFAMFTPTYEFTGACLWTRTTSRWDILDLCASAMFSVRKISRPKWLTSDSSKLLRRARFSLTSTSDPDGLPLARLLSLNSLHEESGSSDHPPTNALSNQFSNKPPIHTSLPFGAKLAYFQGQTCCLL